MTALQYMACNPNAFEMLKMKKRPEFMEAFITWEERAADKIGGVLLQDLAKSGKVQLIPS